MNILVLNRGSSSIKCFLYHLASDSLQPPPPLWEAHIQWKNTFSTPFLSIHNHRGNHFSESLEEQSTDQVLKYVLSLLVQGNIAVLSSLQEIALVGHRIVHGGTEFTQSTLITEDVKQKIRLLSELAPLHNLPELEGIEILEALLPQVPQVAVFDTAFHHTLPEEALIYPVPYSWFEQGMRRYGFHGISFHYCVKRAHFLLQQDPKNLKSVICHLGSGASLCAIKEGKSVDTTMGFTPLEGLMMDTRSGSIDPGLILHLLHHKKKTVEEISQDLYQASGLLGLSGISSDMRDILEKSLTGHPRAILALEIYLHRLNACLGSMMASLQGLDVLIFTAGIGENAPLIRKRVCDAFCFLGIQLDLTANERTLREDRVLSTPDSKVQVLLIHTQEAFEIACECKALFSQEKSG